MNTYNLTSSGQRLKNFASLLISASLRFSYLARGHTLSTSCASDVRLTNSLQSYMDSTFLAALVRAGACVEHSERALPPNISSIRQNLNLTIRRRPLKPPANQIRLLHYHVKRRPLSLAMPSFPTREDYKAILDYYRESFQTDAPSTQVPTMSGLPSLGPFTQNWNHARTNRDGGQAANMRTEKNEIIQHAINIIEDETTSNETLYESYKAMPFPGVSYLSRDVRQKLLRRLSIMEKNTVRGSFLYLSVANDMKAAHIPLLRSEWNSAVYLSGRVTKVTSAEVEDALRMWKEMEGEAGMDSSDVTFNILFDIAVKSGKFVLAEMILKEMKTRDLPLNRYAHVGLIFYYGLRGDGNAVRRTYRDMVEGGEFVDTVVLNCVIASLLRAGERQAAEQVYQRMKRLHARRTATEIPNLSWRARRDLGRVLHRAAINLRVDPQKRQKFQDELSLAPNLQTFIIFLRHHVSETGELHHIAALLDEMQLYGLPIHGRLFMELFRGFYNHGGVRYTSWTEQRLESVWNSFLSIADKNLEEVQIDKWMVIWIIRAFGKCCGIDRTLEIWEELKSRWKTDEENLNLAAGILGTTIYKKKLRADMMYRG